MPQTLMGGDQTFNTFAAICIDRHCPAGEHLFENTQQPFRDFEIFLITSMVEGD